MIVQELWHGCGLIVDNAMKFNETDSDVYDKVRVRVRVRVPTLTCRDKTPWRHWTVCYDYYILLSGAEAEGFYAQRDGKCARNGENDRQ